jgi:sn-glycerol 3-phosphate transport system permease protein
MSKKRYPWDTRFADLLTLLLAFAWASPMLFSILISFRPANEPLTEGNIFFGSRLTLENYRAALSLAPWGIHYLNSVIFVLGTLAVQVVTITMAGYAFARLKFFGRNFLLLVVLLQVMIPSGVLLAQNLATIRALGLFNTHFGMMVVYWGSAFGVLLMRQAFRAVPVEYEEAARIDGANVWQLFRHVYLPLTIPTYVAFAIVSISAHWNEFLWPLIATQSESVRPLTVGLNKLVQSTEVGALYHQLMAGTLMVIAPLVLMFIIFQRKFIESFAQSGLK